MKIRADTESPYKWRTADQIDNGFYNTVIGQNMLRICLADTTQQTISVSHRSDLNSPKKTSVPKKKICCIPWKACFYL